MYQLVLAGVRSAGTNRVPHRPRKQRSKNSTVYWGWLSLFCALLIVTWTGFLRFTSTLGSLRTDRSDILSQDLRVANASGACIARLSGLFPSLAGIREVESDDKPRLFASMRRKLYSNMEISLEAQGLRVGGTQNLQLGDLFRLEAGVIKPVLHSLDVPVRGVVIPIASPQAADLLHDAVLRHLSPLLPEGGLWVQNHRLYHSTMFHASTHTSPVPASPTQAQQEVLSVQSVAQQACPLRVVLERVVVTPGGTVLACWQLAGGTDPLLLRRALRAALPQAPLQQMVTDEPILHTTLARIVAPPLPGENEGGKGGAPTPQEAAAQLREAVGRMTDELCGTEATLDTLWFVEEQDRLALALGGRFTQHPLPLLCTLSASNSPQQAEQAPAGAGHRLLGRRVYASPLETRGGVPGE